MVFTAPLTLLRQIKSAIESTYKEESGSIALLVTEHLTGLNRTAIITDQKVQVGPQFNEQVRKVILRLKAREPIQYIFGKAHFMGYDFKVNESTLIPRQETEELVNVIIRSSKKTRPGKILDIGTGSGCIAITLALNTSAKVYALDVSTDALQVAHKNAVDLGADVSFFESNILDQPLEHRYDLIVSNPPYVREMEKRLMNKNVVDYEPGLALFVADADPLVFYKIIGKQSLSHLSDGGQLYLEINEAFGPDLVKMLTTLGFNEVTLIKDMQHKDRFISCTKPK